jgi:hypothetical protein
MAHLLSFSTIGCVLIALIALSPAAALSQETKSTPTDDSTVTQSLRREVQLLKKKEADEQRRLQELERKLEHLESELSKTHAPATAAAGGAAGAVGGAAAGAGAGVAATAGSTAASATAAGVAAAAAPGAATALPASTAQSLQQQINNIQTQLSKVAEGGPSIGSMLSTYTGSHRFTLVGDAGADFIFDQGQGLVHATDNTFNLHFAPIILYQLTPWMLFEGTISGHLGLSSTFYTLPVDDFQIFLNPYLEVVAGIFDMPFGEFYEDYSAVWVNRFITAPLPYGVNALVPPTEIGIQLRGAVQWGKPGQNVDYTAWMGNGATFANCPPGAAYTCILPGDELNGQTNLAYQSNGRGYGARFRFYPLPYSSDWGWLELGASTYDSQYFNHFWMYAWGVDFVYDYKNFQARGEFLEMYRQMPTGLGHDDEQGWWIEMGYFLNGLNLPLASDNVNYIFQKLEPIIRFSGVNQPAVLYNQTPYAAFGVPAYSFGFNGSPALFAPYSRELAVGIDYWIAPSIVWQTELDVELPGRGGLYYNYPGVPANQGVGVGPTPNDRAVLTQFAIGF